MHALVLPLIAWIAMERSFRRSLRYSSWVIATLLCAMSLALGTRAIWAAFFVTGIGFWWFGAQRGRRAVVAVSVTAASGLVIYLLAWAFVPSVLPQVGSMHARLGGLLDSSTRFDLWQAATEAAYANPWFGIGPMHFATLHAPAGAHPHDWPLQVASEWGLPALLAIVFVIMRWMRAMRSAAALPANEPSVDAFPAIALSATAAVVYGLVDGNWVMPVSQSLAVVLVGASVGLLPGSPPAPIRSALKSRATVVISIAVATGAILGWYTSRSVGSQLQNEREYTERNHVQYFLPRFWQQGIILGDPPE
jgi:O-antigen ligase